jgi:heme exporter protein C
MWFGMVFLFLLSVIFAILNLRKPSADLDRKSVEFAHVGMAFGILGMLTGMFWGKFTWGSAWSNDPKQTNAAISLLVYMAYFVLRGSVSNEEQRGRLSAVYNIFAFAAMIPLLFIIPRMQSSIHPGSGGNPGFNTYDLDSRMMMVFYPAVICWITVGYWIATLRIRMKNVEARLEGLETN